MKRLLLVLGVAVALAGCGGGGGGSSTPAVPNNPGNPGGGTPGPSPTPISTATNAPSTVVVVATSSPIALAKTAVNPGNSATNSAAATVTGVGMSAGSALYATVTDNDKSGSTCLVLIPQGANSGTPCQFPAAGSTPAPVGVTKSGDQVAVQYNNGPTPPTGSFNVTVTANGGVSPVSPLTINYAAPVIGAINTPSLQPWGGGIVYTNGNIYYTVNSASTPIAVDTYANGVAGSSVTGLAASPALTNAPAGGLILGPDGNLWGTEQNATKAFSISTSGATHEYAISCPNGSSGNNAAHSGILGPQTGITTDGSKVYVLCADVANRSDGGNNTVNTIVPGGNVTSCSLNTAGGTPAGPFANGAVFAGGNIISEEQNSTTAGGGAGGASGGVWISIPATDCGHFTEMSNANITGSGNVWLMPDNNLYSETDNLMASTSLTGATAANPPIKPGTQFQAGGGGLAMDKALGSGFFVGTSDSNDAIIQTKWTGGQQILLNLNSPAGTFVPLSPSGGYTVTGGFCEVAFNSGGGVGIVQLPDGKFAWPIADAGLENSTHNNLCFLNP